MSMSAEQRASLVRQYWRGLGPSGTLGPCGKGLMATGALAAVRLFGVEVLGQKVVGG
jgi:hypothetical protein